MAKPEIGSVLGGCEILEVIGHGGMGIIYKARQRSLDRVVALKVLSPKLADDINFVARFQREARAIARVNHSNILAVYDVGNDTDIHYMIMELIEGKSLAELQEETNGPLKVEDCIDFVRQAAQGLEAAQSVGITHRDIKPENLMLTKKSVIKVSDFGLAKEADSGATSTDAVMGTPAFMSPEQCDGKKVDGRTDIYSLGGTFYKLLTGRLPFEAETAMSMMYRHKHEALIPPKEIVTSIPSPISEVVVKMMAKKRERRFQTMTEVIEAIDHAVKVGNTDPLRPVVPATMARPAGPVGPGGVPPGGEDIKIVLPEGAGGPPPSIPRGVTGIMPRSGSPTSLRESGRLAPIRPGDHGDSERMLTRPGIPGGASSARGPQPAMGGTPGEDGFALAARGDELIGRGDRLGGLKLFRQALHAHNLDGVTRKRLEDELQNEIGIRRQAGEGLLERGMLVEAGREFRLLLELDPKAESIRVKLKTIDEKLAHKRTLVNDIRTLIAGLKFEEAIAMWDKAPPDLREEALGKQVEHLRSVTVPSLKLCDQGDLYNEQGRVEEAVSAFQDALRIDENCERARHGLSDAEQKLHRIDTMLKEGYEFALRQEYKEAIDTLRPILSMYPNHPRAVKSIVDACQAIAQDRRQNGDLKSALKAYAQAHEVDPQNRSIAKLYDEMTDLHDKEAALLDRAAQATARGNPGEAISYWQDILRINPANADAAKALAQLKSQRGRRSVKVVVILVVLAALAWVGYQGVTEFMTIHEAKAMRDAGNFDKALEILDGRVFYFFKDEVPELQRTCKRDSYEQKADNLHAAGGNVKDVLDLYDQAIKYCTPEEATLVEGYKLKKVKVEAGAFMDEGEKLTKQHEWVKAAESFSSALQVAESIRGKSDADKIADLALDSRNFANRCGAYAQATTPAEKRKALEEAKKLRPEDPFVLKEWEINGFGGDFNASITAAVALLEDAKEPENAKKAIEKINAALEIDPGNERATTLLAYAEDMAFCVNNSMVLVNHVDPKVGGMKWTTRERKNAFCVDRYEYVEKDAKLPKVNISWVEARQICLDAGKDLCSLTQWQEACKAKSLTATYPFGEAGEGTADNCNWQSEAPEAPGSRPKCVNTIGAYDMSGNVAEWTKPNDFGDGDKAPAQPSIGGGHFKSGVKDATCWSDVPAPAAGKKPEIGFRCCKVLPGLTK